MHYFQDECDNSPRFSVAELREVLQEKNMLKGRVIELEEELEQLRPSRQPETPPEEAIKESVRPPKYLSFLRDLFCSFFF